MKKPNIFRDRDDFLSFMSHHGFTADPSQDRPHAKCYVRGSMELFASEHYCKIYDIAHPEEYGRVIFYDMSDDGPDLLTQIIKYTINQRFYRK